MLAHDELAALVKTLRSVGVRRYRFSDRSGDRHEIELEYMQFDDAGEPGSVAAHNRDSSGATPEPATDRIAEKIDGMELLLRSSGASVPARLKQALADDDGEPS